MRSSWFMVLLPGKMGLPFSSSPKMHPAQHQQGAQQATLSDDEIIAAQNITPVRNIASANFINHRMLPVRCSVVRKPASACALQLLLVTSPGHAALPSVPSLPACAPAYRWTTCPRQRCTAWNLAGFLAPCTSASPHSL